MPKKKLLLLAFPFVLFSSLFWIVNKIETKAREQSQFLAQFVKKVELAESRTGSDCLTNTPVEYVEPPEGSERISPRLVVLGIIIYPERQDNSGDEKWHFGYQLVPQKNCIELWRTKWFGKETPSTNKERIEKLIQKCSCEAR